MRKFLLIVTMKLPIKVSTESLLSMQSEDLWGPTRTYRHKALWQNGVKDAGWNICLSGQNEWWGSVLWPYLFTPHWGLPEMTGKPSTVVIPWVSICVYRWFVCADIPSVYSFPLNHEDFLAQTPPFKRCASPNQASVSVPVSGTLSFPGLVTMFALMKNLVAALCFYLMASYLHPFKSSYHYWTLKS